MPDCTSQDKLLRLFRFFDHVAGELVVVLMCKFRDWQPEERTMVIVQSLATSLGAAAQLLAYVNTREQLNGFRNAHMVKTTC